NRSSRNPFEMPFEFLVEMNLAVYKPYECPQCKSGIPLIKPGSRSS
ncbi:MAG: orotate phosphoribosyltransferase, partial [Thermotogae bacterium]